jgi:hypothetical protein
MYRFVLSISLDPDAVDASVDDVKVVAVVTFTDNYVTTLHAPFEHRVHHVSKLQEHNTGERERLTRHISTCN